MSEAAAEEPWLTLVGIGDGGLASLSSEALDALHAAETIVGGERHLAMLKGFSARLVPWGTPFEAALEGLIARAGHPTVALATGDPMWFGVGATLAARLRPGAMHVIPAPPAFSFAAARMLWPLQDCTCLTAHGRPVERIARHLLPGARLLIYSADGQTPAAIARFLTARGFGASRISVLEHLGGAGERIRASEARDFDLSDVAALNMVAVECRLGRAGQPRPLVAGLPDDAFVHDGKMTKRVLRALAIAALQPFPGDILWDVGAGSGSIGVEWMRAAEGARAIAIEEKPERLAMVEENANALGVPDLERVAGRAPEAFAPLEAPDAVFLGGGLSEGVFDPAFERLKPGGRLVAHAVTLESEAILIDLHARHGGELMRIQIDRAEPVGPYRGFKPAMPVVHWHVTKPQP